MEKHWQLLQMKEKYSLKTGSLGTSIRLAKWQQCLKSEPEKLSKHRDC